MAEEATGKNIKQLKTERTSAKTAFTKQANYLLRVTGYLMKSELQAEYMKLCTLSKEVTSANEEYELGLRAEADEEEGEEKLNPSQESDLAKTTEDCRTRLEEVRIGVQSSLWSRYAEEELTFAIEEAESVCEQARGIPVSLINQDAYEHKVEIAKQLVAEAMAASKEWGEWIPKEGKAEVDGRIKGLRKLKNNLETNKAEFLTVRRTADEERRNTTPQAQSAPQQPILKIKPTSLPRFHGSRREFHQWKKDWENLQRQGEPTGSAEAKKMQLLDSMDDRIRKDLRLSTYKSAEEMFKVLENRFGNKTTIALEIVEDLEKIPPLKSHQPRRMIELIQSVEKALSDLTELGNTGAIKNPLIVKSIESKLPDIMKREWLVFMVNPANAVTPDNHFDKLLTYLKTQEEVLVRLEQLGVCEKPDKWPADSKKYASTRSTSKEGCVICGDERHAEKLFFCKEFKELKVKDKLSAVERLGACTKCLECHEEDDTCKDTYLCRKPGCRRGHHYFLCQQADPKKNETETSSTRRHGLTEEQQQFLSELSPQMAEKCKRAFTNVAARSLCTDKTAGMKVSAVQELPVILMLLDVTTNAGQKIGTLIDLASDTNYITHRAARRLNLKSERITLVIQGVGGMALKVKTKRYYLKVRVKTPKGTEQAHEILCYGLEEIAKVQKSVKPDQLKKFFPNTSLDDLHRPEQVELLISHREGRLVPQRMKVVGDLVLWDGPLGKTVGGTHPDLFEKVDLAAHTSKTHFAQSMRATVVKDQVLCDTNGNPRRETAKVTYLDEEHRILEEDSSVDNVLTSHNDLKILDKNTRDDEEILQTGKDFLKPWVQLGQSGRVMQAPPAAAPTEVLPLPNQRREDENALEGSYLVKSDKLNPKTSVNFSKRTRKMRRDQNLLKEQVGEKTSKPLPRTQLLSQAASLSGPMGLGTPAKQKVARRRSFSATLTRKQVRKTHDAPSSGASSLVKVTGNINSYTQQGTADGKEPKTQLQTPPPPGSAVKRLINVRKFISQTEVIRVVAWLRRIAVKWKEKLDKAQSTSKPKWEGLSSEELKSRAKQAVPTVSEYEDLFLVAQKSACFQDSLNRLAVYRDAEAAFSVCGGRRQTIQTEVDRFWRK